MFVEPTPRSELINILKDTEEKYMIAPDKRIKFVQKCGTKLVQLLQKKDPLQSNCNKSDC